MVLAISVPGLLRAVAVVLAFGLCGCSRGGIEVERIPGTEHASTRYPAGGQIDALTISPNDRWLVFWDGPTIDTLHLSSIDLQTLKKTDHSVRDLPTSVVMGYTTWHEIADLFQAARWYKEALYLELSGRAGAVVLDPNEVALRVGALPGTRLSCSDCPPTPVLSKTVAQRIAEKPRTASELLRYTIAWRDGTLGRDVYHSGRKATILRIGPGGTEEVLLQRKQAFHWTAISRIRISPDEEYLAYVVFSKLKSGVPLPGGEYTVYVRRLETGAEKRIATHQDVSNLIWSADSRRLYFVGNGESGDDPAVYCADISRLRK